VVIEAKEKSSTFVLVLRSPHHTGYTEPANFFILLKYLSYAISYDLGDAFTQRTHILFDDQDLDENDEKLIGAMRRIVDIYKETARKNKLLTIELFDFLFLSNPLGEEYQLQPRECASLLTLMVNLPEEARGYDFGVVPLRYFDPEMSLSADKIRTILQDCVINEEPLTFLTGEIPSDVYEQEPESKGTLYS
jgi:hypothetical protein